MARNFSEWLSGFRDSIADYGYYTDFEKGFEAMNSGHSGKVILSWEK